MTTQIADLLGCKPESVLVCSTGVIGRFLPMDKIKTGIGQIVEKLDSTPSAFEAAARAMMTTDTVCKQAVREVEIAGETICISGAAKGAAMIGPNMATMLSVIMTDAKLGAEELHIMLRHAVNQSFNCISVEGHTSTSDTVTLMASGVVDVGPLNDSQRSGMQVAITEVAEELARSIISDAEGADHLITIEVGGLRNRDEAHQIAQTIANDALVKTAIAGADPNWGRIVSCVGRTGVDVSQEHITLRINGTLIFEQGSPVAYDESELSAQMRVNRDVLLELEFPLGDGHVRFWTSDLTMEYVRLNSEYTT
jgi:glutamate N-acetyltransferase/amino-acid N-acetyltransferase